MNIKTALKASALGIIILQPIKTAVAVPLPEAETGNYVRACNAYGKGYFYIPGTETCLQIGGTLSNETNAGDNVYAQTFGSLKRDTYANETRAEFTFATASDTDWGPLRSFFRIRSSWAGGGQIGNATEQSKGSLRSAFIQLGGIKIGVGDSAFYEWTGYSINAYNDDIINGANTRTSRLSYQWDSANQNLSAIVSLEQGNNFDSAGIPAFLSGSNTDASGGYRYENGHWNFKKLSMQQHNYMPYVSTGIKYKPKWGKLAAIAGYDPYYSEWAFKARADFNLTRKLSVFGMAAYKTMDDYYNLDKSYGVNGVKQVQIDGKTVNQIGVYRQINSMYGDWGGHWAFYTGASYKANPTTSFDVQAAYSTNNVTSASLSMEKQIVPGLFVIPALNYVSWNYNSQHAAQIKDGTIDGVTVASLKGQDAFQGVLKLSRPF